MYSEPSTDTYLAAGYEFGSREPLMIAELSDRNSHTARDLPIKSVTSMAEAERILAAHRSVGYPERLFSQAQLDDPQISVRTIISGGTFAAIGKIAMIETGAYITDVMTMPAYRKQGFGEAIMRQLHADARAAGLTRSVLTSTAMARSLYERLGYRAIGHITIHATPEHE